MVPQKDNYIKCLNLLRGLGPTTLFLLIFTTYISTINCHFQVKI